MIVLSVMLYVHADRVKRHLSIYAEVVTIIEYPQESSPKRFRKVATEFHKYFCFAEFYTVLQID